MASWSALDDLMPLPAGSMEVRPDPPLHEIRFVSSEIVYLRFFIERRLGILNPY